MPLSAKYRPVTSREIEGFAFVDKFVAFEIKPYYFTKIEVAVLLRLPAMSYVAQNFDQLTLLSIPEVKKRCGANAIHLIRQKFKESDDEETEWRKEFVDYNNSAYLARGYKMVGNNYWKLEITKGLYKNMDYLKPDNTVESSLKIMSRLLRGVPKELLVPNFMHKKDYMPFRLFREHWSSLIV